jgi:hypothetical protein
MATPKKLSPRKNSTSRKGGKNKSSSVCCGVKTKVGDESGPVPESEPVCVPTSPCLLGAPCLPYFNAAGQWVCLVIEGNQKYVRFDGAGGLMASNT